MPLAFCNAVEVCAFVARNSCMYLVIPPDSHLGVCLSSTLWSVDIDSLISYGVGVNKLGDLVRGSIYFGAAVAYVYPFHCYLFHKPCGVVYVT